PSSTTTSYPLSLHDALPIYAEGHLWLIVDKYDHTVFRREEFVVLRHNSFLSGFVEFGTALLERTPDDPSHLLAVTTTATASGGQDRKSTRLNSSHVAISYAV